MRFFLFLFFGAFANSLYAQPISLKQQKQVELELGQIMNTLDVVGLSIVVVKDCTIFYKKSFGIKKILDKDSVALRNDDLFRIASISKTFVATAIFQLVEKGLLTLDDDVNPFLNFKLRNPNYENIPITVKMLLSHRSSINDSQGYYYFDMIDPKKGESYKLCYDNFSPGSSYQYCNYNYNILGAVIEGVTGERFDNYIENNITKPLKLNCSYNVNRLDTSLLVPLYRKDGFNKYKSVSDVYKPYTWHMNDKNYKLGIYTPLLSPASGMKISAKDLATYMIMHMRGGEYKNKRIITQKSENLIREGCIQQSNYSYSFRKYSNLLPQHKMFGQTGGQFGLYSAMIFDPEEEFGFIVITNGCKSISRDGYEDLHKSVIRSLYNILIKKENSDTDDNV